MHIDSCILKLLMRKSFLLLNIQKILFCLLNYIAM